jgi:predicted small lipoprotein YifL
MGARRMTAGMRGLTVLALLAALAGCGRDAAPVTPCEGTAPAVPRIKDAAPPTCDPLTGTTAA